jgi:PAS domain S-box-containing protein
VRGVQGRAISVRPPRLSRGLQASFAAALMVVVATAMVSYRTTRDLVDTSRWVAHTHEVREQLASTLSALQDAETGQRGYVITGARADLAPYEAARRMVPGRIARLRALVSDNPAQDAAAEELEALIERRLGVMRRAIRRRKHDDFAGARAMILTGAGARAMEAVRQAIHRMEADENVLLAERVHAANRAAWTASATFAVAGTLAVTLIILLQILVRRTLRDRAENEARRRASNHRFRRVVESNMIGIVFWRDGSAITDANDAFLEFLGYTREDLRRGLDWRRIIPPEQADLSARAFDDIRATGVCGSYETEAVRADGTRVPIICAGAALDDPYDGAGVSWVVDISERKRAESELRAAREVADAANRAKDDFLSVVSHELRTPLTSMTNWLRVLRTGKPEQAGRAVDAIERATRAQTKLVADLLDVSGIVAGRFRLDLRPVDLPAVVRTAVDAIAPAAEAKGVRLALQLDGESPVVAGDPDRLQQIVWNLLSNAMKFTSGGGLIDVRLETVDGGVRLVVRDTGRGISPEFLPRVFQRFQQADPPASRLHGGLGLGLAIVRHLTELHGGSVTVESGGEGKGATFTVALPRIAERSASGDAPVRPEGTAWSRDTEVS